VTTVTSTSILTKLDSAHECGVKEIQCINDGPDGRIAVEECGMYGHYDRRQYA